MTSMKNSLLLFDILRSVLQTCKICIESIMILNIYTVGIVNSLLFLASDISAEIQSKHLVYQKEVLKIIKQIFG